jgi:peptidoglycan DL-endopeptidase CwlO
VASPHRVVALVAVASHRVSVRLLAVGFASLSALVLLPPVAAHADPKVTAAAAQDQLQSLTAKAEVLVEKFDAAQTQLTTAQHVLAADQNAITKAQAALDATKAQVAGVADAAYESGGADTLELLLNSGDPQAALDRASTLTMLADQRGEQLRAATAASTKLGQTKATAAQQIKAIQALQASLKSQQTTINGLVKRQQALLAASQAQIAANAAAAKTAAAAASRAKARVPLPKITVPAKQAAAVPVSASGRAASALKYAYAQLGKPYRWAGAGPYSFDCSGLTMRAWQAAGVSLSHNAAAQYYSTKHVSRSQLQPGDLVYFGHPIHHVGIYIGNGEMIEAPYTGADVRITNFGYRTDYAGASRP